jgi:hypothetical protein
MPYTVIDKSSLYFNTKLYTGNGGSSQSITGVGFQPDFVWIKDRPLGFDHNLFDSVRGIYKALNSNQTYAENFGQGSNTDSLTSFDSDGFSLGGDDALNDPYTYVSWNWKANGTGVSNTAGSITSTVSANTTSGFSIVSYTGNGSNGASVGHGLGTTPAFWIIKDRDNGTYNWVIGSKALADPNNQRLLFNTGAVGTASGIFNPSSTTMTFTTSYGGTNESGEKFIMYCFAEVKGFSKAFSYTGNGSTDGAFTYCGFSPAFLLIKRTDTTAEWEIFDNKRDTYNARIGLLEANNSAAEAVSSTVAIDFLSNGFKQRNTRIPTNVSGGTYIGIAFADNPFVSSKGIPTSAR